MKKILALILITALSLFTLSSCEIFGESAERMLEKAEKHLKDVPYRVVTSISMTSDDEMLNASLPSGDSMNIPLVVDGDNLMSEMSYSGASVSMTLVDGVVYYHMVYSNIMDAKYKVNLTEDEKEKIFGGNTAMSDLSSYNSFATVELSVNEESNIVITCKDMDAESKEDMKELVYDTLGNMDIEGVEINLDDIEMIVKLDDVEYKSVTLNCDYTLTVGGREVNMTMSATMTYEFEGVEPITAPTDADKYVSKEYDDLF